MNTKLLQKNEIIVVYSYRGNGRSDKQKTTYATQLT